MTHHSRPARQIVAPLVLVATLVSLTACSGTGEDLARNVGLMRDAPDEFVVTTRAPLVMPSDLNTLPPPTPGATRPQERSARDAAQLTLAPQSVTSTAAATRSPGEEALLNATQQDAAPDVRIDVNQDATKDATKHSFADTLMFWKDTPTPGVVVDAQAEAKRLQQNAALGRPVTDGNTPVEQPKAQPNWLQRKISGSSSPPSQPAAAPAPAASPAPVGKSWWDIF
ncbi:MAG: DUF3035 domain-containing protein [Acetobacteraceae bacterium]|nr:DUF3035 domain-containing protein [Acetobacteraceae bacterium]